MDNLAQNIPEISARLSSNVVCVTVAVALSVVDPCSIGTILLMISWYNKVFTILLSQSVAVIHQSECDGRVTCAHLLISLLCHEARDTWHVTCGWRVLVRNKTWIFSSEGNERNTRFCITAIHHNYSRNFVPLLHVMKIIRSRSFRINLDTVRARTFDYTFPCYFCSLAIVICVCAIKGTYPTVKAALPFWGPNSLPIVGNLHWWGVICR